MTLISSNPKSGSQPAHYLAAEVQRTVLLAGTGGYGLLAHVGDLVAKQRGGKAFLSLEPGEKPLAPALVGAGTQLACLSASGRLLVFGLDELKLQSNGGRGLTLMDLEAKDRLLAACPFTTALTVVGTGRGGKPKEEVLRATALALHAGKRARKGRPIDGIKALSVRPFG